MSAGRGERADVLVVGAGPAGSTTAGLLAARGWDVLMLERHRFPRPKPCGECLNPGAIAALERLGLLQRVRTLNPAPILGWDVHTAGGARARGRFGPEVGNGLALPRSRLDAALLEEALSRGARLEEEIRVTGVEPATPGRRPRVTATGAHGPSRRFDPLVVVGADGLRSVVARSVGAILRRPRVRKASRTFRVHGLGLPAHRGRLHLSDLGTVGIAPLSAPPTTGWNVTVVALAAHASRVLGGAGPEVLARALERAAPDREGPAELVGGPWASGPFDWPSRPLPAPGVVLVGDAAGYFDPLTGQGIYRALRSAELAAAAIDRNLRGGRVSGAPVTPAGGWTRRTFAPGRRVQRAVEAVVSSRPLRELAIRRLEAAPAILDALIRVTGDARPVASLADPALWFRLAVRGNATDRPLSPEQV